MDDLIAFLRARLDEDQAVAEEAARRGGAHWPTGDPEQVSATMAHRRRHEPARVLREVEAKRKILTEHYVAQALKVCTRCSDYVERGEVFRPELAPCRTVRLLAEPYADHDDYREEWRP